MKSIWKWILKSIVKPVNTRNWEKNSTRVMNAWIMDTISISETYEVGGKEKMSYQYDRYLAQHKSNVEAGFRWLQKNLPEITEGSGAEHNIVFAHDQSKTEPDEYGPYDIYFYGGNRSYGVVEDFRKAWLLHIHRNPHHWQYWVLINDAPEEGEIILEMPYCYVLEMICDWWSFSWFKGNLLEIFSWYEERKSYIKLHPNTRRLVEDILGRIKNKLGEVIVNEINR